MRGSFPLNGTYFQVNEVSLLQLYVTLLIQEHDMDTSKSVRNLTSHPDPTGQKDYLLPS
jgi:hypothetical protein